MTCLHCHTPLPVEHACCERAELDLLRVVVDRAIATLRSEITAPVTLADDTLRDVAHHTTLELTRARARAVPARAA